MKRNRLNFITILVFCLFLAGMFLGTLFPKASFSWNEKRYLAKFPEWNQTDVFSGKWGDDLEKWMADHIPGRNFFVGLDAYKEFALGLQNTKEIRRIGPWLVEAPVEPDSEFVEKNMAAIRKFADCVDVPVTLSLVPSAGFSLNMRGYEDSDIIRNILGNAGVDTIDLTGLMEGHPEYYYKTDHHWTSQGACQAYREIGYQYNKPMREQYEIETIPDCFQGSTYTRSALWLTPPEDIALWHGSEEITVTTDGLPHGVFYRGRLEEADKYQVYLDGNHPVVTLENPKADGKLLVIRDSYANCLAPFLAESWAEVTLVDLRYYHKCVSQLVEEIGADDVLILYSLGNFVTDANLRLLN